MPINRFFSPQKFQPSAELCLEDREYQHLVKVTRTRVGDEVEVVNGKGQLARARLESHDRRSATLAILDVQEEPPPAYRQVLAQALPRLNRLDTIVEKCTELGVSEIQLFPGDHSEKKELSAQQKSRVESIAVAAMKQSGRLYLPEVKILPALKAWGSLELPGFFGDLDPQAPLLAEAWAEQAREGGCMVFIGPESGFSAKEEERLRKLGVSGIKLHGNILRTDTAPIVAFSIINHCLLSSS